MRIQALFSQRAYPAQARFLRRALHEERQIVAAVVEDAADYAQQAGRDFLIERLQQRLFVETTDETPLGRTAECQLVEESVEGIVKARLLIYRLGERQGKCVPQQALVANAYPGNDIESVERFRRRNTHIGIPQRLHEARESYLHERPTIEAAASLFGDSRLEGFFQLAPIEIAVGRRVFEIENAHFFELRTDTIGQQPYTLEIGYHALV